ncbi:MAG TPA: hypothetical protein VFX15_00120, partial [Actinomycetes bacterium]|nr:hypothetical protein [Actinomycetes bacterium]
PHQPFTTTSIQQQTDKEEAMSDGQWHNDHDEWLQQFNMMVNEALDVDPEEPFRDDADEMAMSDIAAKLMNGKIELPEAIRRVHEWLAGRLGVKLHRDHESFMMEMEVNGLLDITDATKVNLLTAGEVGIADAIIHIYGDPRLLINGPGDAADISNPPSMGVHSKAWFTMSRMSPKEQANLLWAVQTALKEKLSE